MTIKETPLHMLAGHMDHHPQCPEVQVAMKGSLKVTYRNQAMKSSQTITSCFPPASPRIQKAPSQFPVQLLLLAAPSSH